jgi:hypothetical protein
MTVPNSSSSGDGLRDSLRHNGVDVGKMDFLGPINLVDAKSIKMC